MRNHPHSGSMLAFCTFSSHVTAAKSHVFPSAERQVPTFAKHKPFILSARVTRVTMASESSPKCHAMRLFGKQIHTLTKLLTRSY